MESRPVCVHATHEASIGLETHIILYMMAKQALMRCVNANRFPVDIRHVLASMRFVCECFVGRSSVLIFITFRLPFNHLELSR